MTSVLEPIKTASWFALKECKRRNEDFDEMSNLQRSHGALK